MLFRDVICCLNDIIYRFINPKLKSVQSYTASFVNGDIFKLIFGTECLGKEIINNDVFKKNSSLFSNILLLIYFLKNSISLQNSQAKS